MRLIAVDPGKSHIGIACFQEAELKKATILRAPRNLPLPNTIRILVEQSRVFCTDAIGAGPWDKLVCEFPQIYGTSRQKGNQNTSILPLILMDGALLAGLSTKEAELVEPARWKGTIDPDIVIERAKNALSPVERAKVTDNHNAWDAVGIGLWHLRRMHKQRG
jgi:hypothetical protein